MLRVRPAGNPLFVFIPKRDTLMLAETYRRAAAVYPLCHAYHRAKPTVKENPPQQSATNSIAPVMPPPPPLGTVPGGNRLKVSVCVSLTNVMFPNLSNLIEISLGFDIAYFMGTFEAYDP